MATAAAAEVHPILALGSAAPDFALTGVDGRVHTLRDYAWKPVPFDPKWDSAVPYTILLSGDGKVLYKQLGSADMLELKRIMLANLPSDYVGFNEYWKGN